MSEIINSSLKTAAKGTTLVLFSTIATSILWFVSKLLIVKHVTKMELGIFSVVIAVVSMLSLITPLGMQEGVTRFVSIFTGEGKKNRVELISRISIHIGIMSSTVAFVFLYLFSEVIARHIFYKPELIIPLKILAFYIPFYTLSMIISAILRGRGIIKAKVYYFDLGQAIFFLLFVSIIFLFKMSFTGVFYAYLFSIIVVFFLIGTYGYRKIGVRPVPFKGGGYGKELLRFSLPVLGISILGVALTWTDTLMLGRYVNAENVGAYNISMTLARLLSLPLNSLTFVFMPIAGEMYARNQLFELNRTNLVLTKWIFSAAFPLFFILFFFPDMIITFLFGSRFADSATPLRILSVGFLLNALLGTNGTLMMVMNLSRELMKISIMVTVLNVLMNYTLIKLLGLGTTGAAIATMVSYASFDITASFILYRKSRIHPSVSRYIKPVVSASVIGLIIYAMAKSLPLKFWMLPLYFVLFLTGYALSLLLTRSIDKEDISMLDSISEKTGIRINAIRRLMCKFAYD